MNFREALRIARVVNNSLGIPIYTGNLAELALDRKDWKVAEDLAREAIALEEGVRRKELIANHNWYLARALVGQGKAEAARPYARLAVEIFTQLRHRELAKALATLNECGD